MIAPFSQKEKKKTYSLRLPQSCNIYQYSPTNMQLILNLVASQKSERKVLYKHITYQQPTKWKVN